MVLKLFYHSTSGAETKTWANIHAIQMHFAHVVSKSQPDSGLCENTRGSDQAVGPWDVKGELKIQINTLHSCGRQVYRDKLSDSKDLDAFDKAQKDFLKKKFEEMNESEIMIKPLIFCHFAKYIFLESFLYCIRSSLIGLSYFVLCLLINDPCSRGIAEAKYMPVSNWSSLNALLTDALKVISPFFSQSILSYITQGYNELNAAMDLVLFEDAMSHICKVTQVLSYAHAVLYTL